MIMTGTEKQIEWAKKIRAEKLARWAEVIAETNSVERARNQMLAGVMSQIVADLENTTDAVAWIEGRDCPSIMLHCVGIDKAKYGQPLREVRAICAMMR